MLYVLSWHLQMRMATFQLGSKEIKKWDQPFDAKTFGQMSKWQMTKWQMTKHQMTAGWTC